MFASRFKSIRKWFENCIVRPADEMNVPDFIGAFLFVADGTGLPGPDAENKNGSERSERAFI